MTVLKRLRHPAPDRFDAAVLRLCGVRTASAPLPVVLLEVLDAVTLAIPSHSCSVLIRAADGSHVVRASDGAVETLTVDGVTQLSSPVRDALASGETVNVGRADVDQRWPVFADRAGETGLRSVLSTGLAVDDSTAAVVAYWSSDAEAFTTSEVTDATAFAAHLAPVLHNAVVADGLARRNANLVQALTSRAVIDQAIGIVMSRTGSTAEQAMDRLRSISQREHVKVHEVAHRTVRDAVMRTRARLPPPTGSAAADAGSGPAS